MTYTSLPGRIQEDLASAIDFSATVPRSRVHRAALAEVFITDVKRVAEDCFLCGAQIPRSHPYFGSSGGESRHYDLLLLAEIVRQAVMAGAHEYFGVPESHKFVLTHNSVITRDEIRVTRLDELFIASAPTQLALSIQVVHKRVRENRVTGLDFEVGVVHGPAVVAHARMGMVYKSPESYQRLRSQGRAEVGLEGERQALPPIRPEAAYLVGRRSPDNVVLGSFTLKEDGSGRAPLYIDESHPSIFDHPQDHIPGMLMNEAYRQVAIATAEATLALHPGKARLTRLEGTFTRFGELDLPAYVTAEADGPVQSEREIIVPLRGALEQQGTVISTAEIELTYPLGVSSARELAG